MKRLFPLLSALLVACGSLETAPTTGQLLGAPTTLNMTGRALTAQAAPRVDGDVFRVRLTLQTPRAQQLPAVKVTDLYVVTRDGVWSTAVGRAAAQGCGKGCLTTDVTGPARGLQRGAVQVVVGLRDAQGRSYLLRDETVSVR
ncbi:hypothetical protein [Deinococcus radiodurans]|jgi:hypothetical protein|uniref:Lipoprotein n=1 Tax=Deinococcus radiodurans (strain ATCC 13939 / DSM 20539 / JCM 16871 / CCUG 27074 / LMG 4051 / NBRC 15346 / NCIMB 9279 / VKM B-1422 / R1) TaxID=243230 RepID=Q9RUE1_DEIRA|nr:hypothetical protein [Deinococcus radiodurans]AAF11021.1 hypothetical protein DR_1446 [Deinococcus radiodurans R1 = ATCC 13939 = DSM 20539]ANC71414.1 hypothetical protein A2G07_06325 [Deinococcus radiodurans R1 = ATCC 13939 = DSM 20539]QEM70899.1 hypothetical protein DXG80_03390 [Deinococcus radiodurans]QIP29465.1 hypothetical protein HAV23_10130 [Deinococcus radiodurans]QIP31844.1 hypothetical protein HAV35_06670 [Deinococcus radiodurans]